MMSLVAVGPMVLDAPSNPIFGLPEAPLAVGVFLVTYAFILAERLNRALVALAGAGILIFAGVLNQQQAVAAIDWNTIGLLLGMMVIVSITSLTGVFEYLAIHAARMVKGHPVGLLLALSGVTALCSGLLDNVTTVMLVTPVILSLTKTLKVNPWPFLVATIFASNIGGTATLVGDPPNIMIGSAMGFSFNAFLLHLAPLAAIVMVATMALMVLIYRADLVTSAKARQEIMALEPIKQIKNFKLLTKCMVTMGLVVLGFLTHHQTGFELASIAMAGAVFLGLWEALGHDTEAQHHKVQKAVGEVEWVTLLFFVGLFILVSALVKVGVIGWMADQVLHATDGDLQMTMVVILWGSAILSALVDNIPYVATMIPLLQEMSPQLGTPDQVEPLWWALAAGACLGGNGSLVGASANLVVAGLAAKQGYIIRFMDFLKVGFPLMLVSIVISHVYFVLRYF